jgi:hypothetical protein
MGCSSTRFSPTETSLLSKSLKTGLEACSTDHAVGTIRRYALDISGKVNSNQLLLIKAALDLDQTTEALKPFYASVTETDRLIVAAVLLSEGTAQVKATALFEVLDRNMVGKLTNAEVTELLNLVVGVTLDSLPLLVSSPTEEETAYLEKSRADKAHGVGLLSSILLGRESNSSKEAIVKTWVEYENGKLLQPDGLRHYLSIQKKD